MTDRILTQSITTLRFPLSIGIVLLHTIIVGQSYPNGITIEHGQYLLLDIVVYVSQREIGDIAVPLFFFISGFLFYYRTNFTFDTYKKKLKKRIRSLLIPYLIWNTLWLVFMYCCYLFIPTLLASTKDTFDNYTIFNLIDGYVGYGNGPSLGPLWFIRDLMFINLFAYPLFYLIKRIDYILIPLLLILFTLKIGYETPFIGTRSWTMYVWGAWFAINKKDLVRILYTYRIWIILCFILIIIICPILNFNHITIICISQVELIVGVFSLLLIAAIYAGKKTISLSAKYANASFFIFVSHMFIINLPNKLWVYLLPANAFTASLMQITIPIITGLLLYYIYVVLNHFSPRLLALIIGGRN